MSDHALAVIGIIITISLTLIGCGVAALTMTNHPDKAKAAKVFFSAAAIASLFAGYFWTVSTTYDLFARVVVGVLWLSATVAGLIVGFRLASRSSLAELSLPASAFVPEPLWPRNKKLAALTIIGILVVTALLNATREPDVAVKWLLAQAVIFWGVPWKWVLPAMIVTAIPTTIVGFLIARRMHLAGSHTSLGGIQWSAQGTVRKPCPDQWLHQKAEDDKASMKNLVRIPGIAYQSEFGKAYIDFVFSVFNNSLYDIVIDNSLKDSEIRFGPDNEKFYYDPKIESDKPIYCGSRSGNYFVIRQAVRAEEITRFQKTDSMLIGFHHLHISFQGTQQFPEIQPTALDTNHYLETTKGGWRAWDQVEFICSYTEEQWALLSSSNQQEVGTLKAEIDLLRSQLSQVQQESEREKIPHRRERVRVWLQMLTDVERKYKSGNEKSSFAEILERQPGYKTLGPLLSAATRKALDEDRLDGMARKMIGGPHVDRGVFFDAFHPDPVDNILKMLAKEIARKEQDWGLL